jgi:hypothetical protein
MKPHNATYIQTLNPKRQTEASKPEKANVGHQSYDGEIAVFALIDERKTATFAQVIDRE